jgi:hypothetical protein
LAQGDQFAELAQVHGAEAVRKTDRLVRSAEQLSLGLPRTPVPDEAPTAPVIFYESQGCVIAGWKNISIGIWATDVTVALVAELDKLVAELVRAYPIGGSAIHLVADSISLPSAPARAALAALTARYAERLVCMATVLAGSGFWASAMRGFLTGLQVLERRPFKSHTFATIGEAAAWVAVPHTHATHVMIDAQELERVLLSLIARPSLDRIQFGAAA